MAYKPPIAVYDACVLYPFHLRNLLMQCAVDRLVEARWSDAIHEEWIRSLLTRAPALSRERLIATRDLMNQVVPDATVTGYERHIPSVSLPDPDDRHVVAAAIESGASVIVTWNLRDFPAEQMAKHGLRCTSPDDFLSALCDALPAQLMAVIARAHRNLRQSPPSMSDYIATLEAQKLRRFVTRIRKRSGELGAD